MFEILCDALLDAFLDSLKLLPFLFVTYLFMEWLEHGAGRHFEGAVARAGRIGPLVGALLGVVPQCGFSGAAATLYAGRVVTLGTVIAVFLATSDEMLPIMISEAFDAGVIVTVLAVKVVAGMVIGFLLDAVLARRGRLHEGFASPQRHEGHGHNDISELCEREGCACDDEDAVHGRGAEDHDGKAAAHEHRHDDDHDHDHDHAHGIVLPALRHSLNVIVFIFIITLALNLVFEAGLEDALASITNVPFVSALVAGVVGLIPNCAVSVALTELYLEGVMGGGALVAGLCVNAGIGLLVLFRTNRDQRENLKVTAFLLASGVLVGCVVQVLGVL